MPQFYVVKGIGGGFDGLIVETETNADGVYKLVTRIIDPNMNVGDRTVSLPIPLGALSIHPKFLDQTDDPGIREFASDNPFGKMFLEGHMDCGDLKVTYSQFEKALSVVVFDTQAKRTIFSQYFTKEFDKVKQTVEAVLKQNGGSDAEDLVFQLRALKEAETNGQEG